MCPSYETKVPRNHGNIMIMFWWTNKQSKEFDAYIQNQRTFFYP
jgi:hypothetical protein